MIRKEFQGLFLKSQEHFLKYIKDQDLFLKSEDLSSGEDKPACLTVIWICMGCNFHFEFANWTDFGSFIQDKKKAKKEVVEILLMY